MLIGDFYVGYNLYPRGILRILNDDPDVKQIDEAHQNFWLGAVSFQNMDLHTVLSLVAVTTYISHSANPLCNPVLYPFK